MDRMYTKVAGSIPSPSAYRNQPVSASISRTTNQCLFLSLKSISKYLKNKINRCPAGQSWISEGDPHGASQVLRCSLRWSLSHDQTVWKPPLTVGTGLLPCDKCHNRTKPRGAVGLGGCPGPPPTAVPAHKHPIGAAPSGPTCRGERSLQGLLPDERMRPGHSHRMPGDLSCLGDCVAAARVSCRPSNHVAWQKRIPVNWRAHTHAWLCLPGGFICFKDQEHPVFRPKGCRWGKCPNLSPASSSGVSG